MLARAARETPYDGMSMIPEARATTPVDAADNPFGLVQEAAYRRLSGDFYTLLQPETVPNDPVLVHASAPAAHVIELDPALFQHPDFAATFSGQMPMAGFEPLAMVYSGHQFGQWAGQLGDGRALTIGQVRNHDGALWDIQLKGAGRTPYSRFGDGRAVLRSSIREYLCSEAMAALGVPTTRALAVVATRARVLRETVEPGAVVTRLLRSNIRFGHFEHFHHGGKPDKVRELSDFVIATYHPALAGESDRYARWFDDIVTRTANLMAHWQSLGFCHGVMNTDNMSILGDTIDYGPFGFLDAFDPAFICNHSDHTGRYAFDRQPGIALWNLQALAFALQTLVPWDAAKASLEQFVPRFVAHYSRLMSGKIGIGEIDGLRNVDLVTDLLGIMKRSAADYTRCFRLLSATDDNAGRAAWTALFSDGARADAFAWLDRWHGHLAAENADFGTIRAAMDRTNPAFVLRNWVAETAIRAVEDHGDVATLDRIFRLVTRPFDAHGEADERFAMPPAGDLHDLAVSCSS